MSNSHDIMILNLENLKIHFEDCIIEKKIKHLTYKVIHAKLSYRPDHCPLCGNLHQSPIHQYGFNNQVTLQWWRTSFVEVEKTALSLLGL